MNQSCSVAKTPVYPQVPAHAPIWLNLCMPLIGLPAGCGTPLRNRASESSKAMKLRADAGVSIYSPPFIVPMLTICKKLLASTKSPRRFQCLYSAPVLLTC